MLIKCAQYLAILHMLSCVFMFYSLDPDQERTFRVYQFSAAYPVQHQRVEPKHAHA